MNILSSKERILYWTGIFALNLLLPSLLSLSVLHGYAFWGTFCGVVCCWLLWIGACNHNPTLCKILIIGAIITAASQILAYLHFLVGSSAVSLASRFNATHDRDFHGLDTMMSGFVATVFTGLALFFIAFVVGIAVWVIMPNVFRQPAE